MNALAGERRAGSGSGFIPITLAGSRAVSSLGEGVRGEIAAVVSQAAYLCADDGTLLWLSPPGSPAHPRAVLAPLPLAALTPGARFHVTGGELLLGERFRLQVEGVPTWSMPSLPAAPGLTPATLRERARRLAHETASPAFAPGEFETFAAPGLSDALKRFVARPLPLAAGEGAWRPADERSPSPTAVGEGVGGEGAVARNEGPRVFQRPSAGGRPGRTLDARVARLAKALLGLGPGLTPSGDDAVGGVLFALHVAAALDPGLAAASARASDAVLQLAPARTNAVSRALLEDYARGEASQPVAAVAACLVRGDQPGARAAAARLAAIGSSTGIETLNGILAGLLAASYEMETARAVRSRPGRGDAWT